MHALVIVESSFGNTHAIAEALAEGLTASGATATLVAAGEAPSAPVADLVVLAAPTHNLGLPTPASRAKAGESGGEVAAEGVREWLERTTPSRGARVVTIDTVVAGMFSGSAAKKAQQLARKRGWAAERGPSFVVTGTRGPLADGELDRARTYGASLR